MRVHCATTVWHRLERLARRAYPAESCALLFGRATAGGWSVLAVDATAGLAGPTGFAFPAAEILRAEQRFRARGLGLCGVFHSHPDGRPVLSAADRSGAYSEHVQLVAGVRPVGPPEWAAWAHLDGSWRRLPIDRGSAPTSPGRRTPAPRS